MTALPEKKFSGANLVKIIDIKKSKISPLLLSSD